jgi:hypothetical protein
MATRLASRLRRLEARLRREEATLIVVLTYVDPGGTEHTRVRFRYHADGNRPNDPTMAGRRGIRCRP